MNTKTFDQMTTAEMVAEYNILTGKSIKKFSSRAAGEQQLTKARELFAVAQQTATVAVQPAQQPEVNEVTEQTQEAAVVGEFVNCPQCGAHLDNGVGYHMQEVNGKTIKHEEFEYACLACGGEFGPSIHRVAKSETRSAAVAATWENDQIAAARSARDNVAVNGKGTFRSVAAAFKALGLPMSKHIKFRIEVKSNGTGTFKYGEDEYEFRVVKQEKLDV